MQKNISARASDKSVHAGAAGSISPASEAPLWAEPTRGPMRAAGPPTSPALQAHRPAPSRGWGCGAHGLRLREPGEGWRLGGGARAQRRGRGQGGARE
eukprot:scaffold64106_cov30-Tisochrysis_lutea.AAC.3